MKFFANVMTGVMLLSTAFAQAKAEVATLTIDASDKVNFVYYGLNEGQLVPVTEQDNWIFGVRRYIFKTPTGTNGAHVGGSFLAAGAGFEAFNTCADLSFSPDEEITMAGFTISANLLITSEWYDYNEQGAVKPQDKFIAIASDNDCLKLKIQDYVTGVYTISYDQVN